MILFLLFLVEAFSQDCPTYKCSETSKTTAGKCLSFDGKLMNLGTGCKSQEYQCNLLDVQWYQNVYQDSLPCNFTPKVTEWNENLIYNHYCNQEFQNFRIYVRNFCEFKSKKRCSRAGRGRSCRTVDSWDCNFEEFQRRFLHNSTGLKDFAVCKNDIDCASNQCECGLNVKRCEASVYDQITKELFESLNPNKKYSFSQCLLFISYKHGVTLYDLQQQSQNMSCLANYSDYKILLQFQEKMFGFIGLNKISES